MTIPQADSTLIALRQKVRRLTNSPGQSSLTDNDLDQHINTFYNQDFAYAIKVDQMRSVYTFYTQPYRDRYPLDVNFNQGLRSPVYFDGIQGAFYKDRTQFYNLWPRIPTRFQPISGDGITTIFSFTIPAPFLSKEVTLGGVDTAGNPIQVVDDGNGNLQLQVPNPATTVPPYYVTPPPGPPVPPVPGMHNQNLGNPGLNYVSTTTNSFTGVGNVNYVTGQFNIEFPVAPAAGTVMTLFVSQYQTGKPYNLLFWNNELTIRPVPKLVHKVEVESYLTPVQFMQTTDSPIINQWWQYISYGVACEIQRERNDFEGVNALMEGMKRQEALVLERQGVEEIGQPNYTLFNSTTPNPQLNNFWGLGFY